MSASGEVLYDIRANTPDFVERERAQVISLPVYRDGALVAPSAGTLTVQRPDGTSLVSAQAVTISGSIAQYSLTALLLASTEPLSVLWLQVWVLTLAGLSRVYRREMILCRRALYPTVTEADLIAEYPDIARGMGSIAASLQQFIDLAWKEILRGLLNSGRLPHLMVSASAFFDWHRHLTLVYICKAYLRGQEAERWRYLAEHHAKAADAARSALTTTLDSDEDGKPDDTSRASPAVIVHPNAAPTPGRWAGSTSSRW